MVPGRALDQLGADQLGHGTADDEEAERRHHVTTTDALVVGSRCRSPRGSPIARRQVEPARAPPVRQAAPRRSVTPRPALRHGPGVQKLPRAGTADAAERSCGPVVEGRRDSEHTPATTRRASIRADVDLVLDARGSDRASRGSCGTQNEWMTSSATSCSRTVRPDGQHERRRAARRAGHDLDAPSGSGTATATGKPTHVDGEVGIGPRAEVTSSRPGGGCADRAGSPTITSGTAVHRQLQGCVIWPGCWRGAEPSSSAAPPSVADDHERDPGT